jgi:tetratricopeptide (TPR) repeat protein
VLVAEGQREAALASYRASHAIFEALARQDPGNAGWQRDLSVSHEKIGDVLVAEGQREAALASYRASHAIFEALARQDPGNAEWQRDLIVSFWRMAEVDPTRAAAWWRRALDVARALAASGRLAPVDAWMPAEIERRLREAGG